MARVEWTRTELGDIEQVVSVLLCLENPSATRIRPSRSHSSSSPGAPRHSSNGLSAQP